MRIKCSFSNGYDTPLLSKDGVYTFRELVNEKNLPIDIVSNVVARVTHKSMHGVAAEGYVEYPMYYPLLKLGCYVPGKYFTEVGRIITSRGGKGVAAYAPIEGNGYAHGYPIVLSDGENVAFCNEAETLDVVDSWTSIRWTRMPPIELYVNENEKKVLYWGFYNPSNFSGIDPRRFLDLEKYRIWINRDGIETPSGAHKFEFRRSRSGRWYFLDRLGIPVMTWGSDREFLNFSGEIGNISAEKGLFSKVVGNKILLLMLVELQGELYDHEEEVDMIDFFREVEKNGLDRVVELMNNAARKKAIASLSTSEAIKQDDRDIIKLMEENKDVLVTLTDADEAGSCAIGTRRFLRKFGLKEEETIESLLKHPKIKHMLNSIDFKRVVLYAIYKNKLD